MVAAKADISEREKIIIIKRIKIKKCSDDNPKRKKRYQIMVTKLGRL